MNDLLKATSQAIQSGRLTASNARVLAQLGCRFDEAAVSRGEVTDQDVAREFAKAARIAP